MKHTYYSTCPICGANLDPGEKCTCTAERKGSDFVNDTQVNRDRYVEVIVELLKKANVEKLDLVWTFAKGIIR
nr:MAG TPA: Rad50 zinc hook motif [Caudoviricetes sp.]